MESFPHRSEFYKKLDICAIWPEEEESPNLSLFVGHDSLLPFYHLEMADKASLSWLNKEPEEWDKDIYFDIFRKFVKGIEVVNDCAER